MARRAAKKIFSGGRSAERDSPGKKIEFRPAPIPACLRIVEIFFEEAG
jgi:hypothetical protein